MSLYPREIVEYLALMGIPRGPGSKIFVVDAVNGSDANSGDRWTKPLATVAAAFAKTTTLHNDVVLLVGNGTSNTAAAAIAWDHDFTHLVGLCSPIPNEQRSRIKCAAALATTPFITWSASGCVVRNISFWHETTDALGLVNVLVSGGRNMFENCQFAGAVGTNNSTGARSLKIGGAVGSGNYFKNCTIGNDTIQLVTGVSDMEFVSGAMHNTFDDCVFTHTAGAAANSHLTIAAAAGCGRMNIFRRCLFINEAPSIAQTEVVTIGGGALSESNRIIMLDCWQYGSGKWDNTNRGVVTNITIAANTTGVNTGNTLIITSA